MLSKTRAFILIIIVLLSFTTVVTASDETWQVEQRCVPEPITPSEDWTYPGTILLSGYAGIHGVQADWETPHVVVFFRTDANGDYPIIGGQLSPDSQWYALVTGESWVEVSFNRYFSPENVRVSSTDGREEVREFRLHDYEDFEYFPAAYDFLPVLWRNEGEFKIGNLLINPIQSQVTSDRLTLNGFHAASPDLTRTFGSAGRGGTWIHGLIDVESFSVISEYFQPQNISWRRDSAGFIAQERTDAIEGNGLSYYDRDGNHIEHIFDLGEGRVNFQRGISGRNDLRWSPDNSQFAFVYDAPYPEPNRLYIIDWNEQIIIDTCLSPTSDVIWSPDGTMLAYLEPARENLSVVVLDTSTWQAFDVARHSGLSVPIYSSPDMVGWRD